MPAKQTSFSVSVPTDSLQAGTRSINALLAGVLKPIGSLTISEAIPVETAKRLTVTADSEGENTRVLVKTPSGSIKISYEFTSPLNPEFEVSEGETLEIAVLDTDGNVIQDGLEQIYDDVNYQYISGSNGVVTLTYDQIIDGSRIFLRMKEKVWHIVDYDLSMYSLDIQAVKMLGSEIVPLSAKETKSFLNEMVYGSSQVQIKPEFNYKITLTLTLKAENQGRYTVKYYDESTGLKDVSSGVPFDITFNGADYPFGIYGYFQLEEILIGKTITIPMPVQAGSIGNPDAYHTVTMLLDPNAPRSNQYGNYGGFSTRITKIYTTTDGTAQIDCQSNGGRPILSRRWLRNGIAIPGKTSRILPLTYADFNDGDTIICEVTH